MLAQADDGRIAPTMTSCQACGSPLPVAARFCPSCGDVVAPGRDTGSRRPVTIVFTDIVGSTALGERLDAETLGGVMTRYYETMRECVERHGGAVEKFIGDAVVATFGVPDVHEDDALRAVRAAVEMHAALGALNGELHERWAVRLDVRTGVASGEIVAGGGPAVLGSPANLASRLQGEAGDGEILLAANTHRLVRDAVRVVPGGRLDLKGFDEPMETFRLVGLSDGARRSRRAFVGRHQESALIDLAFRRGARDRRCQLLTVTGDAGIGKTRLVDEAVDAMGPEPLVLRGRCLPYGEGITFFPIGEAIATAAGIERDDGAERARAKMAELLPDAADAIIGPVAEAIGLGGSAGAPEETTWAIRRFFELLAAARPLVLVFDDLQWGEPTFLDLVAQLAERTRGVAMLVVAVARPELFEQRPTWGGGVANAVTISLEPLTDEEGARIVREIVGEGQLAEPLATALAATAGGNPLFLEEYVSMLLDDGTLTRHGDRWEAAPGLDSATSTPPTLTGLLTTRLTRLPPDEREALVHASVIGKVFSVGELTTLMPESAAPDLDAVVARLLERDLLRLPPGATERSGALEFQHQLLRDAAYGSLPKTRRAELHQRFAERLEAGPPGRPEELDEIVGYHLAQAHDYRAELGAPDASTRELADRAAARLGAAGRRAVERGDATAGIRLLNRATALATQPGTRALLRLPLCQALSDAADPEGLEAAVAIAIDEAKASGDERLRLRFEHLRSAAGLLHDPRANPPDEISATLREMAAALHALGDDEGVAECYYQLASVAWIVGDAAGFEGSARRALEHAIASGNVRSAGRAADYVITAGIHGATPLPDVLAELQRIREAVPLGLAASADLRTEEAEILAYLGRTDEARELVTAAKAELTELGMHRSAAAAETTLAIVEDQAGDLGSSEAMARRAYLFFLDNGDVGNGSLLAVQLADVLARLGRSAEADDLAVSAAEMSAEYDLEAQAGWRMASARARAALGDADEGIRLAQEGLKRLDGMDQMLLRGDLLLTYGDVLAEAGRAAEASARWREANDTYRRKGHVVGARRAGERLGGDGAGQLSS